MTNATKTIYASRLSLVQSRMADLNKRAAKIGMEPMVLLASEPRSIVEDLRTIWVVDVTLIDVVPKVNGYTFLASLEHTEAGNIILKAPAGEETDMSAWGFATAACQHCSLSRNRKNTFLLRSEAGEVIQIGRNCLADYLRSSDVERTLAMFAFVSEALLCLDEEGQTFGCRGHWTVSTVDYVAAAVASVRKYGFRKSGSEGGSTRADASFLSGPCPMGSSKAEIEQRQAWLEGQPSEFQRGEAEAMIAWCLATTEPGDYMHSLRVACALPEVNERARGLLASLPACYDRAMGIERAKRERKPNGPHFGQIGDRFDAEVEVMFSRGYAGMYGEGTMLIMRDTAGHVFQWFGSGEVNTIEDFSGKWYLRATVKRHEQSKKTLEPITLVTRCKLSREPFSAAKPKRKKAA